LILDLARTLAYLLKGPKEFMNSNSGFELKSFDHEALEGVRVKIHSRASSSDAAAKAALPAKRKKRR
jgi:hypothetical protein